MVSRYSLVHLPKGLPVATFGLYNAYNAGMLAYHILSVKHLLIKAMPIGF
ncbi:AIR carboxylase family protein [Streptobacillus moniliformis]